MRRFPMTLFSVALVYSLMTLAFASSPALTAFSLHHDSSSLPHVDLSHGAMVDSPPGLDTNNSFTTHAAWIFSRKWATGAPQTPPEPEAFPTSLTYTVVPRRYIPLRLKGSRTSIPLNVYGERVLVPTPTRYHQPEVEPVTALDILGKFLRFTLAVLLRLFSSPLGIWASFKMLAEDWLGLAYDLDRILLACGEWLLCLLAYGYLLAFCSCKSLLSVFLKVLSQVEVRSGGVFLFSWQLLHRTALDIHRLLEDRRLRQLERERTQRIIQMSSPDTLRPFGRHLWQPLFQREVHDDLKLLLLPEEVSHPVRHMYDPRYFNCVKTIGSGAFGSIYQVENRITGKMMALKRLMQRCNTGDDIDLEIRAMLRVHGSLWFPTLLSSFMDPESFYLLMPLFTCDLYTFMTSCGGCLHRTQARFYLAELLLAIQYLHKKGIIHRDLKPENILFDQSGYLVVADFGVAYIFPEENADAFMEDEYPLWAKMKRRGGDYFPLLTASIDNPHTVTGVAGTMFYSAPEVIEGNAYSYGVDYYSAAILYHEMITGYVPIRYLPGVKPGTTEPDHCLDLTRKDVHLQPISMADLDFLVEMLNKDPFARPNVKQMKTHPVFAGINWEMLCRRDMPVPGALAIRKRVPISPSIYRHMRESGMD